MTETFYLGRRLSYDGFLCTVRYVGSLEGTSGKWLGVEWDDITRGKHDGRHRGQPIFRCLSSAPTAASFVRSSRKYDPEQTVVQAIKSKYGHTDDPDLDVVVISGKVAEEVGFDKIAQEQARLADLRIVLIDQMVVNGLSARNTNNADVCHAQVELRTTCPNIVELDLGWNTFESWADIANVCAALPKLKVLRIGGSRFSTFAFEESSSAFSGITQLSLESCLIQVDQLFELLLFSTRFASLEQLWLQGNGITEISTIAGVALPRLSSLNTLDLTDNGFQDLNCIVLLTKVFPMLQAISLQANRIKDIGSSLNDTSIFPQIQTLNLSQNNIPSFAFIDMLPKHFPNLKSLHITSNPFFAVDRTAVTTDPKATDKKYYLTLARIASLQILNYTKISVRDREEGEIYYLSVADDTIQKQIKSVGNRQEAVKQAKDQFPRYDELANKYGHDSLAEKYLADAIIDTDEQRQLAPKFEYPAGSLGARVVTATFYMSAEGATISATMRFPSTIPVTRIMGLLVQHATFKHHIRPLRFRLIYESTELDPVDTTTESTTRSVTYGRRLTLEQKRVLWEEWGSWDADAMVETLLENKAPGPESSDNQSHDKGEHWIEDGRICIRDGRRFKAREVVIPPALKRPLGDWLEGSKVVRIRIEPYQRS